MALPDVPHANVTILNGGGRSYGTIVRYECEPGYVRSGQPVLLCMSNGTWSGDVPSCSKALCPIFPEIKNGFIVDQTRIYMFGDEARVQCYKGKTNYYSNIKIYLLPQSMYLMTLCSNTYIFWINKSYSLVKQCYTQPFTP